MCVILSVYLRGEFQENESVYDSMNLIFLKLAFIILSLEHNLHGENSNNKNLTQKGLENVNYLGSF